MKEVWCVLMGGEIKEVCDSAFRARVVVQDLLSTIQDRVVPWDVVTKGAEWVTNGVKIEITRKDVLQ